MTEPSVPACIFVVDTDSYAGNFERDMTAFITGQLGECGVGDTNAKLMKDQFPDEAEAFEEIIGSEADEHGCSRPCTCWPTPGYYGDGHGGTYTDADDPAVVRERYLAAVHKYYDRHIEQAQKQIDAGDLRWERDLAGYKQRIAEAEENGPGKYMANNSVAIYFSQKPTAEQIAFMKERALEYAANPITRFSEKGKPIDVSGFRLIEYVLTQTETVV